MAAVIGHRCRGCRPRSSVTARAKSTEIAIMTTTANRPGECTRPMPGTKRRAAQGVGIQVFTPPTQTNGPRASSAKKMAKNAQRAGSALRRCQKPSRITAGAAKVRAAAFSAKPSSRSRCNQSWPGPPNSRWFGLGMK